MEYDFKTIYKTFDVSYFSNDKTMLNDNIVDSKELKNYESIEKSADDLIVILIKRFKLRISIRKNRGLSKHIIISDDYNFEPAELKHDDSMKIAIVKDNLDKWTNLDSYDYIFTFRDYIKELREHGQVFPIEDTCVFTQIKFILNNLYKRKLNKFHYFLKEVDFQRVFPKTNDYFRVFNSDFFDYEWYRDTYGLKDNTDSVIHYLLIGSLKGYDPGPNFSVDEYYQCNEDVKAKGVDALLHYERYGRKENRFVSFEDMLERSYDAILNSEYFDGDWYKDTYEIFKNRDAAYHYLQIGYAKGYNPGPDFSTQEYYELNWAVKEKNMNPLVHYELFGRRERRKIYFSDERHKEDHDLIFNSPYFDGDWYKGTYEIDEGEDAAYHYLYVGYAKGYNPGPDFSTQEYYECNNDVKLYGMNPLVHYERHGRKENRFVSLEDMDKRSHNLILNSEYFDGDWYKSTYELGDDVDPVDHYLNVGHVKGYNPGPDFSTQEYIEVNRDVPEKNMNPLVHYELFGRSQKRDIGFTEFRHKKDYDLILSSVCFDGNWYMSTYELGGYADPIEHYLTIGYAKGYNPGPDFSTQEYYECNNDVKLYGMNPLVHYERHGRKENRFVSLEDMDKRSHAMILNSEYFDGDWYKDTYELDDDVDPVDHYLNVGYVKRYNPGPDFNTQEYIELNKDVTLKKMNPLIHYELFGRIQNRTIRFSEFRHKRDHDLILNSEYFDGDWYMSTYELGDEVDPVEHYLSIGYAKGYDPGPDFSTQGYYERNIKVKRYGTNPLIHYERYGRKEGRKII